MTIRQNDPHRQNYKIILFLQFVQGKFIGKFAYLNPGKSLIFISPKAVVGVTIKEVCRRS